MAGGSSPRGGSVAAEAVAESDRARLLGGPDDAEMLRIESQELRLENVVEEVIESYERGLQQKHKHNSFKLFMFLYTIFLLPSLWYLFGELFNPNVPTSPDVIPMSPSALGLLGFVLTVFALYGALRVSLSWLGWKQNTKTPAQHKEDLLRIGRLSTALGIIGRVANRVHAPDGLSFLALIVIYTAFFTVLYEVSKNLNIKLTKDCVRNPFTLLVTAVSGAVLTGVLALHVVFAAADRDLAEFLGFLILGTLFHVALLVGPGSSHVHVHHWYWAFAAAHMCVFDSRTSQVAQAMFCGCYIHGVALFGAEKCFYESSTEDEEYY